mmetsp:Transcript_49545/g.123177  ORF Transcript_49545/g.123177 Transcript_49545/m.123177 type:complete len:103 (-) Transcript_49545:81-389(-)
MLCGPTLTRTSSSYKQGEIDEVPAQQQLSKMPASLRDELHKAHARWLTKKRRPLTLVEDAEYREIWKKGTHGTYSPPDCTTLRAFILELLSKEGLIVFRTQG